MQHIINNIIFLTYCCYLSWFIAIENKYAVDSAFAELNLHLHHHGLSIES